MLNVFETVLIIEKGQFLSILSDTAGNLLNDQLIYYCNECDYYHIEPGQTMETVLAQKHEYDKNKACEICVIVGEILHLNLENKAMENFIRPIIFSVYPENDPDHWISTVASLAKEQFPEWEVRINQALLGQTLNDL